MRHPSDGAPFFVASAGEGILIGTAAPRDAAGKQAEHVFELQKLKTLRATQAVAEVLQASLPRRRCISNPMLAAGWQDVVKKVDAADTAFLFSQALSDTATPEEIVKCCATVRGAWIADLPDGEAVRKACGAALFDRFTVGKAWAWKVDGNPGRIFVSSDQPAFDARVEIVLGNVTKAAHGTPAGTTTSREVRLLKADPAMEDQHFILGIVLAPETVDSQSDIYSADEVRRAAHGFMEDYQNIGHMHRTLINDSVRIVESYLAPVDFSIGEQQVKQGTWLLGVHVLNDALWGQVKAGSLTGFSIGGFAQRVPAQAPVPAKE